MDNMNLCLVCHIDLLNCHTTLMILVMTALSVRELSIYELPVAVRDTGMHTQSHVQPRICMYVLVDDAN